MRGASVRVCVCVCACVRVCVRVCVTLALRLRVRVRVCVRVCVLRTRDFEFPTEVQIGPAFLDLVFVRSGGCAPSPVSARIWTWRSLRPSRIFADRVPIVRSAYDSDVIHHSAGTSVKLLVASLSLLQ